MSVPEMERNLTGVLQQLTMNKMKNGGFAQMLVRCRLSSLSPCSPRASLLFISNSRTHSVLDYFSSVRGECLLKKKKAKEDFSKFYDNLSCLAFGDPRPHLKSKTTGGEQEDVILRSPLTFPCS